MTQEHAKYEQEVIYGTTYDIYIYRNKEILDECRTLWGEPERVQLSNVHGAVA